MNSQQLWQRFQQHRCEVPALELTLDISRMTFDEGFFARMAAPMKKAFEAMDALERGAIANPDEKRMVGHYWLRNSKLAPQPELRTAIDAALTQIKSFTADVHAGKIKPPQAAKFTRVLLIGIGGSALGPMFVHDALGQGKADKMQVQFIDNTDPDGIARILTGIGEGLKETLALVISKSGGTPETRNGMLCAAAAYEAAGLKFAQHAVAVTGEGSNLDKEATKYGWVARFPMWDWVGGRTSETSAVGLLPAALQGIDIDALLSGAALCDAATRVHDTARNPAALMALMWHHATGGVGKKDLVVLPYKDRLMLISRYLQQLIMESLGKKLDLEGKVVEQGLAVYGNKGSTDQHAYVQQLRDGVNNFFVTFVRVLEAGGKPIDVEPNVTPGDYLHGFLLGSRAALFDADRQSMTITVRKVDAKIVGALIALFERAVGLYATLVNINAYHQPGVEAGKKAAGTVLDLQAKILAALSSKPTTAPQVAENIGQADAVETVFLLLEHLAANGKAKLIGKGLPSEMTFASV